LFLFFFFIFVTVVKGHPYIVLDVPLLFEAKMALNFLSFKVVVHCGDDKEQISRLLLRNKELTEEDAQARLNSQMKTEDRIKKADICIDNSKDLENTKRQVREMNEIFQKTKRNWTIKNIAAMALIGVVYVVTKVLFCFF
jgi:dephospho-CoA kinase